MRIIIRSEKEIDDILDWAADIIRKGTTMPDSKEFSGKVYDKGAVNWECLRPDDSIYDRALLRLKARVEELEKEIGNIISFLGYAKPEKTEPCLACGGIGYAGPSENKCNVCLGTGEASPEKNQKTESLALDTQDVQGMKPCPFCGSEARLCPQSHLPEASYKGQWAVVCQNPDAKCNVRLLYCTSKQEAISQWNRRVERREE